MVPAMCILVTLHLYRRPRALHAVMSSYHGYEHSRHCTARFHYASQAVFEKSSKSHLTPLTVSSTNCLLASRRGKLVQK